MKISKIYGYSFLRNDEKGYIIQNKKDEDRTAVYLESSNPSKKYEDSNKETLERIKVSYINKIFKNSKGYDFKNDKIQTDKDKIYHALVELIYKENIDDTIKILQGVKVDNLGKNLSNDSKRIYTKYIVNDKERKLTLQDAFESVINNNPNAKDNLTKILEVLKNKIEKRKADIKKSIENNKTPFIVDSGNRIVYQSKKGNLINQLKKDMIKNGYSNFVKEIEEVEKKVNLEKFIEKFYQNDFDKIKYLSEFRNNFYCYKKELMKDSSISKDEINDKVYLLDLYLLTVEEYFKRILKTYNQKRNINTDIIKKNVVGKIKNALTQQMINEGKIIKYFNGIDVTKYHDGDTTNCQIGWIKKEFNSSDLIEINNNETTNRKIIEACVFATNNLANIMNLPNFVDILLKSNLKEQITSSNFEIENRRLAKLFFDIDFLKMTDDEYKDFLWAVRGSIQSIRNQAYHNTKNASNIIFNVQDYEIEDKTTKKFYEDNTYLKNLFKQEIKTFKLAIIEKFKGMKLFDYFTIEFLNSIFKNMTINPFDLQKNLPSFNKMIERGQNIIPQSFLKMTDYDVFSKNDDKDLAIMNLHKVLYEYDFKHYFLSNATLFKTAVSKAIERKKKDIQNISKINLEVLKEFSGENAEDIQNYLADLQSAIMLKSLDIKDNKTNAYYLFLLDITSFGFDNYIKNNFKNFDLTNATQQTTVQTESTFEIKVADLKIDITNENIAFFTFAKLLNNDILNELQQKLIKFQQNNEFQNQIKILEVCKLKNDNLNQEDFNPTDYGYEEILKTFVSNDVLENKCLPYYDDKNPIIFKEIYLLIKYGTLRKISTIFKETDKVTSKDLQDLESAEKSIVQDIKNRDKLHNYIIENSNNLEINTLDSYIYFIEKVNDFVNLKNKVYLTQIYKMHTILCKVLAKPINFVGLWDKNFVNIVYSYCYEWIMTESEKGLFYEFVDAMNRGTQNFKNSADKLPTNIDVREFFEHIYLHKKDDNDNWRNIRNKYAHLDILKNGQVIDLKEIVTDLRKLFTYDRNSKNKITRSFKHLLERNNLDLDFEFNNDNTFKLSLSSKKILYFKNCKIPKLDDKKTTDFYSKDYVKKIKTLLNID